MAGHIAESYEDVHTLLSDAQTYTRPASEHGSSPLPDPFTQPVLAELEPYVRKIVDEVMEDGSTDLPQAIAQRVAELVIQRGLVPETLAREGIAPSAAAIASALEHLSEAPDDDGLAAALDEVLRWAPPIAEVSRVDGAGTAVVGRVDLANRDPARFADADQFDPRRKPNQHLSFGRGKHYCSGAALARLQMAVTVQAVLGNRE